ncbi:MAG: ABC transporter permease [Gemmatimonadetes bacterium]|nr:ABC transporter permease [Gemmatimonadota bacterium]MBP6668726.1 ABC transporter permease [Gemmatimonadales bacterium]MBK6780733.1 ABC transporter permease [Gemmatimonadota bacterium]MBK7351586.1 ABC transporter permease [Gemmatimonadota bacterium]MBK7716958.1 ABC transporter permease [Gemmatimonadota bacterium]
MDKIFAVMRREFVERVRTKAFIIGTVIVPLMTLGFGYLPQLLMQRETRARHVVLLDAVGGATGDSVESALRAASVGKDSVRRARYVVTRLDAGGRMEALRDSLVSRVGLGDSTNRGPDGIVVLTAQAIDSGRMVYYGNNVASFSDMNALERALEPALRSQRLLLRDADPGLIAAAGIRLDLDTKKVSDGKVTGESGESSFWLAYITSFVMYLSLVMYGVQVMGAVLEEKSNRIVEVLISSMTPFQLLLGKVLGVAGAGLLQLAIWGGAGFYLTSVVAGRSATAGMDQLAADGTARSFDLPTVSVELVLVILVFFLLGFLLYSALYAAVGSMCTTQQETQQAAQPVTIILAVGFVSLFALLNDSSSSLARILSFIPFFAPMVIPVRYAISPLPLSEVLIAVASTLVGMVAVVWLAGRIYRVGILSYGKKPSIKELWRWVRTD